MDRRDAEWTIGASLRSERETRGVSQSALARRTGVPQPAISRIEAGTEVPSLERWSRLLAGLGLRPEIELKPLAQAWSEEEQLEATQQLTPGERLERAGAWMKLRDEIRGKARRASS
jgi:transcriptional regulator with XRE-family HTH domain